MASPNCPPIQLYLFCNFYLVSVNNLAKYNHYRIVYKIKLTSIVKSVVLFINSKNLK